jgi:hypothetical protein
MKRSLYVIWAFILLLIALRLVDSSTANRKGDPVPNEQTSQAKSGVGSPRPEPDGGGEVENSDDKLEARKEPAVDLSALGIDAEPFQGLTSDTALIRILASYQPPSIGKVEPQGRGRCTLELPDGRRFEATEIGSVRSEASNGTVAFEAITAAGGKKLREVDKQESGVTTEGNPQEIWTLSREGRSECVSPKNVHAEHPIVSPDGRYVAFTARAVVGGVLRSKVLMIRDLSKGKFTSYADRSRGADYEIKAVDWVEDGAVLRVMEDWGETGGHLKLKQVRVR